MLFERLRLQPDKLQRLFTVVCAGDSAGGLAGALNAPAADNVLDRQLLCGTVRITEGVGSSDLGCARSLFATAGVRAIPASPVARATR